MRATNSIMVVITKGPYGTALDAEGFRCAIGCAGMDIKTTLVLLDDGVFAALGGQDPSAIGMKPMGEAIGNADSFGIELLVCRESLDERGISPDRLVGGKVVTLEEIAAAMMATDGVIRF
ncbi:MAG: DsrE family protein [Firmicutes bacterium]|nr:DsrE family protein [Bacillota bacterium]